MKTHETNKHHSARATQPKKKQAGLWVERAKTALPRKCLMGWVGLGYDVGWFHMFVNPTSISHTPNYKRYKHYRNYRRYGLPASQALQAYCAFHALQAKRALPTVEEFQALQVYTQVPGVPGIARVRDTIEVTWNHTRWRDFQKRKNTGQL